MTLIFREFLSRAGHEERVLTALRQRAAAMIRNRLAEVVLVCQRADVPQHLLWIQNHAGRSVPVAGGEESLPSIESRLVESHGAPVRAEFVDGAYQFPLPLCCVWGAQASDENTARTLLNMPRLAASDRRIAGVSVYRTVEVPSRIIAFLGLEPDMRPADHLEFTGEDHKAPLTFYLLRISWTVGRLQSGAPSASSLVRYPRGAFWARLGLVSPRHTAAAFSEQDYGNEPHSKELRMAPSRTTVYVVTCEQCGQMWHRASVIEGQTTECVFCGHRGRLCIGALPAPAATSAQRVEAWLVH